MSDYTPSVDEVRDRYADARVGIGEWTRFDESVRRAVEDAQAEFDRMIEAVRAEEREKADREPSDAEVEAAAAAMWDRWGHPGMFHHAPVHRQNSFRTDARAALIAAQEVRRG